MKAPTAAQLEEMMESSMDELRKESGGDFDEYAAAFFRTGFKLGVNAMLLREALTKIPTNGKEN